MNKLALALVLALGASAPAHPTPYVENPKATVRVDCVFSVGTAVKISEDRYITAAHVVDNPLCTVDGAPISDIKKEANDFATFTGKPGPEYSKVSCKGFKIGEYYLAKGYALGLFEVKIVPWLATPFVLDGFHSFLGDAIPGMSGGPVVNDRGEVAGVVNMRFPARSIALKDTSVCKD